MAMGSYKPHGHFACAARHAHVLQDGEEGMNLDKEILTHLSRGDIKTQRRQSRAGRTRQDSGPGS
jgi:hypothetical protein